MLKIAKTKTQLISFHLQVKGYPKKAKNYDDLAVIPPQLSMTADKKQFLIFNEKVVEHDASPHPKRILLFMSEMGRDILANSYQWYVDGTFKSASCTLFKQVLMILVKSGTGKVVPALFGLLPDKEQRTYR